MTSRNDLLALDDVVGVADGVADNQPCIRVYLKQDNPATRAKIPSAIDGVDVVVEISGELKAN